MFTAIFEYIESFDKITIQCHDVPDADTLASAWGFSLYLKQCGHQVRIVYGGKKSIKKRNLLQLISLCEIPLTFIGDGKEFVLDEGELLLVMDAQYGATNVTPVSAEHWAVIDHHPAMLDYTDNVYIRSQYQSCATIIWEMLLSKGFPIEENKNLRIAFSYALFTDTSGFADLHNDQDIRMKKAVGTDYPELDTLKKSNLTVNELLVAADAIYHNFADYEKHYMIISALKCDQTILGVIGDLAIQVDIMELVISVTSGDGGYQFSIRSCGSRYHANAVARHIAQGLGGGGGHETKAGGFLSAVLVKEQYPGKNIEEVLVERLQTLQD